MGNHGEGKLASDLADCARGRKAQEGRGREGQGGVSPRMKAGIKTY